MAKTVLLLHTLADGSSHFDWMLERESTGGKRLGLLSFRVSERVDLGMGDFCAELLADHRAEYLDYEGDVSGGRGSVQRVAAGMCRILDEQAGFVRVWVGFGSRTGEWVGRRREDSVSLWVFSPAHGEA